jgi:hypothetical protein
MNSRTVTLILLRIVGAGLLAAMAAIHLYLWADGYRSVPTIGLLFMLNGIGGGILTLAVLAAPKRFLAIVAALSSLFTLGTLGALILSLTVGLFGFLESMAAPLATTTLIVESLGVVVLAGLAVYAFMLSKSGGAAGAPQGRDQRVGHAAG